MDIKIDEKYSYNIEGIHQAVKGIIHGGEENAGNQQLIARKTIWFDNSRIEVPFISGNSIRGVLRRKIMADLCSLLDYSISNDLLWESLFQGGCLQQGSSSLNMALLNRINQYLPPIALFACVMGNQMLEGKLIVEDMEVCCIENKAYLPPIAKEFCQNEASHFIGHNQFTRRDERLVHETTESLQMFVKYEHLIAGTNFYHQFRLRKNPTSLEISCLHRIIELWMKEPTVGGKIAMGCGQIKLNYTEKLSSSEYVDFIHTHREEIIKTLEEMTQYFVPKTSKKKGKKAEKIAEVGLPYSEGEMN